MTRLPIVSEPRLSADRDTTPGGLLLAKMREVLKANASGADQGVFHAELGNWLGVRVRLERPSYYDSLPHGADGPINNLHLLGTPAIKAATAQGMLTVGGVNKHNSVEGTVAALELRDSGVIVLERAKIIGPNKLSSGIVHVEGVFQDVLVNPYALMEERASGERELKSRIALSRIADI